MTKKDKLETAYNLKSPEDSRKLYADWAENYETDFVESKQYVLHQHVALAFTEAGGEGPILDVGAGTGLCAEALTQYDPGEIDGTDISIEMLEQAMQKGVYRALFPGDILAGLPLPDGVYDGVVSSGTFTLGHVGPDGLDEVVRLLAQGGLAVIAVRDLHYDSEGFADKIAELEPKLMQFETTLVRIYADDATGEHADDKALLLHMWKA